MENEANNTELVPMLVCTQPPVIAENLLDLQERVRSITDMVSGLPRDADSIPQVKKARADLRKYFDTLEEQRKAVKAAVMLPYNEAEAKYKSMVSGPIQQADRLCKDFVDGVESAMKRDCEAGLREYFAELCVANHVEFLRYEQAGIVVDMASAKQKTPKKLRELLVQFVARVASAVSCIAEMEDADEIMVEYQNCLSISTAIATVMDRHRRIKAQREAAQAKEAAMAAEAAAVQKVEAISTPVQQQYDQLDEVVPNCRFTVSEQQGGSLENLENF